MSETPEKDAFLNAQMAADYTKLSDAKLVKKIKHLRGAIGRCSLPANADRIAGFLAIAHEEANRRIIARRPSPGNAT